MNTAAPRVQTSFRLNENLISSLKKEARAHNRSLNNYVESLLMAAMASRPNPVTLAAMKEAETNPNLETVSAADFMNFVDSL